MAIKRITDFPASENLVDDTLTEVAEKSEDTKIEAVTISAASADNSFNDSGGGFIAAGFAPTMRVNVEGFVTNSENNLLVGTITDLTASKMTLAGTDGDVILDEAEGATVTIRAWESRAASAKDIFDYLLTKASPVTLSSASAVVPVDMAEGVNFTLTLDEDTEIANPANAPIGQSGTIYVTQDGTGWTPTWASNWKPVGDVTADDTANIVNVFSYFVRAADAITLVFVGTEG